MPRSPARYPSELRSVELFFEHEFGGAEDYVTLEDLAKATGLPMKHCESAMGQLEAWHPDKIERDWYDGGVRWKVNL